MAAVIQRNETAPANLRCDVLAVGILDGSKAPRKTSFAGDQYVSLSTYLYQAAIGTLTNKRRPLTYVAAAFTADAGTNEGTQAAHGLETGDGPFTVSNAGGALPAGLVAATNYWLVNPAAGDTGGDVFKFATSLANAYAGTTIDLTTNGTGVQTLTAAAGCSRGIDGQWNYEFASSEVTTAGSELSFAILGHATYEAYSSINYVATGAGILDVVNDTDGSTVADEIRAIYRTDTCLIDKNPATGEYVVKKPDGTDSHHGTITNAGRVVAAIDDLAP